MTDDPIAQLQIDEAKAAMRARAQVIADELIGTAKSYIDALEDREEGDGALETEVRELAFECDQCGWWASTEELHNDPESGQTMDEMCEECFDGVDT